MFGFGRFNFALRTCSPALIVNVIASFDKAMLDVMEVIWNRGFSESQRELACLPWAFVLAWPIYVASRVQSQDLQSKMATAAPFDFDRFWLPILCSNMFRQMICKQRLLLLNHDMHFLILFMLGFVANFGRMALLRYWRLIRLNGLVLGYTPFLFRMLVLP